MEETFDDPDYTPNQYVYAGFGPRLLAYIIDSVIISFVLLLIMVPVAIGLGVNSNFENFNDDASAIAAFAIFGGIAFLATIGVWLYFALMESGKYQGTLGKMVMGIKVTDMNGERVTFWQALGRTVAKILSGAILYIGYLMIAFTDRQQGLHDLIANCLVVKKDAQVGSS